MDVIKRAVEFYGKNNQMVKAMEEMADVLIMCEQLKIMFDSDSIKWYQDYKTKRLAERLNNAG